MGTEASIWRQWKRRSRAATPVRAAIALAAASLLAVCFALAAPAISRADPGQGPGGPVLVVNGGSDEFGKYYAEILRNEGLNEFEVAGLSAVTPASLAHYDVVVLGETPLSNAEAAALTDWVQAGGNLIAMRPDAKLAGVLGITDAGSTLSDAYLKVDTSAPPGKGIVDQTIQFHGPADRYTLSGASAVATLYSDATTATSNPAVTLRSVGANGGQAAAFTYDLARSIVYTRQGNPAWRDDERDGTTPLRPDDLFFGDKAGDHQPDWVDLNKVAIPQADEQQRLLANLIEHVNADRKPLPRFWYLPRMAKAAVVMTGDDHSGDGTSGRFALERSKSPAGCSVADWECVRSTSYVYPDTTIADPAGDQADGFEIGLHLNTGCSDYTAAEYGQLLDDQLAAFHAAYPSVSGPVTNRNHCIAWSGWADTAKVEHDHGIRLDTNYYYWPPGWVNDRPGMFTGSGMPMRFADLDGSMLDVYQATTQMTDESGQSFPGTIDALLDKALGPEGYYGAFVANMHTDSAAHSGWEAIVDSARSRGVPVVSARQMLDWVDARNASSFSSIDWSGGALTFTIDRDPGANGLRAMLPTTSAAGALTGLKRGGVPVATTTQTIKGVEYAVFDAQAGAYEATYAADTTAPAISGINATAHGDGTATVTWQTDEPSDSRVDFGTDAGALGQSASEPGLVTSHSVTLTGLDPGTTYFFRVSSADVGGNSATSPLPAFPPATFATPSNRLVDTTVADFDAGATGADTQVSQVADGEVILRPTEGSDFSGTSLPAGWTSGTWESVGGGSGGSADVSGGALTVNGAFAGTSAFYGPGRSLEFVATFLSSTPFTHIGFGVDYNNDPSWAMFSVKGDGHFYARTNAGGPETELPGSLLGSPHRYRIDWNAGSIDYYVDGALVAHHDVAIGTQMRPLASEFNAGGGALSIDWLRMSPYAPDGTFESRVLDAGGPAEWGALTWTADTPAGTSIELSVRTGDTPTPDGSWTAFSPIAASGDQVPGNSRYVQYRAHLTTTDPARTPTLSRVEIELDRNPTAVDDAATLDEDAGATSVHVLANDTDPDGGPKAIQSVTDPSHGTVAITGSGAGLTYAPDADYCNTDAAGPGSGPDDTFTYTLNGGSTATVSVIVTCQPDSSDVTAPDITINRPTDGGRYSPDADPKPELNADYSCSDTESGVASCTGTVADGAPFDRSSEGTKTFTVTATDHAGNTATKSVTYRVLSFANLVDDDDPLAYYRLGDGPGSATMHASSGPSGEYKNGQSSVPFGISGDGDAARRFTGADGYGYANGITAPRSYTLSAFVRFDDDGSAMVVQHGSAGAIWREGSRILFRPVDWGPVQLASPGGSIVKDRWYHVAGTYRWVPDPANAQLGSGTAKLYLDGAQVDSATSDKQTSGASTFYVGYGDKAPWLRGILDEVAYFPTALSATRIHEIWLADPPPANDAAPQSGSTGGDAPAADGGAGGAAPSGSAPSESPAGGSTQSGPAPSAAGSSGSGPAPAGQGSTQPLSVSRTAKLSRGVLTIDVACAAADCAGKISVSAGAKALGSKHFRVRSGRARVTLKLSAKSRRALGKSTRVNVVVTPDRGDVLKQRVSLKTR